MTLLFGDWKEKTSSIVPATKFEYNIFKVTGKKNQGKLTVITGTLRHAHTSKSIERLHHPSQDPEDGGEQNNLQARGQQERETWQSIPCKFMNSNESHKELKVSDNSYLEVLN